MRSFVVILALSAVLAACGETAEPLASAAADGAGAQDQGAADSAGAAEVFGGVGAADAAGGAGAVDVVDAGEPADAVDVVDSAATPDAVDVVDTAETPDSVDVVDTAETPDPVDVVYTAETPDSVDVVDTFETPDIVDVVDTAESPDAVDAVDAAVTPDAIDAVAAPDTPICVPTSPSTEICDGLDNDCDGKTDSGDLCADGNSCTSDACNPAKGCSNLPAAGSCDDGNACTTGEFCAASTCQGGKAKCDDGDACTADSCDAAGTCSNTALAGCKPCTAASQCSDNDGCTGDSCTAGKCAWAPISGCVGPTNYAVNSFSSSKATLSSGAVATFTVTVANLGKPVSSSGAAAKLQWEVWFSADAQLDDGDTKVTAKTWSSYNIGAPNQTAASESQTWTYAKPVMWFHKYQCVKLVYYADAKLDDNVKCIPVSIEDGEVGLKSVIAAGSKVRSTYDPYAQPTSTILLETANPGTKAVQPSTTVYLSQDDKWDATDMPISLTIKPAVAVGNTTTTLTFATLQFQSTIAGKVWVCVRSDVDVAPYEQTPGDNTVCGQVDVENPAELMHGDPTYTNGYLTFDQTLAAGSAAWGAVAACKKMGVYNVGMGKVAGGFAARCFLSTTGAAADASWMVQWKTTADLASGTLNCAGGYTCGAKTDLVSPLGPKVETPATGATKLCVEVNFDKAVLEANYTNNTLCVPATVVGANIQVNTKLTAESGGAPVALKVGVAWSGMFAISNYGNADLTGVDGKFLARIWLSVDNKLSADDVKLWEGVQTGFNSFTKQVGQFPNNYALPTSTTKPSITVKAGTAPGNYFLLYQINADNLFAEPLGDNLFAKPAAVSP